MANLLRRLRRADVGVQVYTNAGESDGQACAYHVSLFTSVRQRLIPHLRRLQIRLRLVRRSHLLV